MKLFVMLFGLLGCLGILVISRGNGEVAYYFQRQFYWFIVGCLVLFGTSCLNFQISLRETFSLYGIAVALLLVVSLCGIQVNGMRGWFRIASMGVQPSELLKPVFLLVFARVMSTKSLSPVRITGFCVNVGLAGIWIGLILLQPDAGTAMVYAFPFCAMLFVAGTPIRFLATLPCLAGATGLVLLTRYEYMWNRLAGFFSSSPENFLGNGWHGMVMEKALQQGGWFGAWLNPSPVLTTVPYRSNDSIFAVLSEQLGFFGMLPLMLLILFWLGYCCLKSIKVASKYHQLLFIGCGVMLSGQAILHLAVNLGMVPPTGITCPFISYGGSSLIATMIIAGIADAIS